jgi:hypothetical protein
MTLYNIFYVFDIVMISCLPFLLRLLNLCIVNQATDNSKFDVAEFVERRDKIRDNVVIATPLESFAEPGYEHPLFSLGIPKDRERNPVWKALVNIDESGDETPAPRMAHGGRVEKGVAGPSSRRYEAAQPYKKKQV